MDGWERIWYNCWYWRHAAGSGESLNWIDHDGSSGLMKLDNDEFDGKESRSEMVTMISVKKSKTSYGSQGKLWLRRPAGNSIRSYLTNLRCCKAAGRADRQELPLGSA